MIVAVRAAALSDMEALSAIFRTASLSNEGDRTHLLAHPDSLIFSDIGVRQGRTRVAFAPDRGGEVLGFASWLVVGEIIELEDLFVDPKWMRKGIGLRLVLDAVAIAREQSFDRLEVTANPHAQEFYGAAGFVADHVVETDFYPGQRMHIDVSKVSS